MAKSYFEFDNNVMNSDIQIVTWNEFSELINELNGIIDLSQKSDLVYSVPIFRGVKKLEYGLKTTLERYDLRLQTRRRYISEYNSFASDSLLKINSFLGTNYKSSTLDLPFSFIDDGAVISENCTKEEIGGWIFLRHHGFPSPILDWTMSPYIAAYFAYRDVDIKKDSPAIFLMLQCSGGRMMAMDRRFYRIKYDGVTHSRHYLQQCEYTIALEGKGSDLKFWQVKHKAIDRSPIRHNSIIRIRLPREEKFNALLGLQTMNINEYSLFMTNDSLVKMVADQSSLYSRVYLQNVKVYPGDMEFD